MAGSSNTPQRGGAPLVLCEEGAPTGGARHAGRDTSGRRHPLKVGAEASGGKKGEDRATGISWQHGVKPSAHL